MPTEPDARWVASEALPHTASSLLYYLNTRIHWVNAPFDNQYAQQVLHLGHDYYWDDADLQKAWAGTSHPVYLILEKTRLAYWQALLPPGARVVNKSGTPARSQQSLRAARKGHIDRPGSFGANWFGCGSLLLNQTFFYPDTPATSLYLAPLADHLVRRGHDVTVLPTSRQAYDDRHRFFPGAQKLGTG